MKNLSELIEPSGIWTEKSAFIFDVYGTIAEIGHPTNPYKELIRELVKAGYNESYQDKKWGFLTQNKSFETIMEECDGNNKLTKAVRSKLLGLLSEEVESIRLYDDVITTFKFLIDREIGVALCSNLAQPYAEKVKLLLADAKPDVFVCSFEEGIAKPHPNMFLSACKKMGIEKENVVVVGDSQKNDIDAAESLGMKAIKIDRTLKISFFRHRGVF